MTEVERLNGISTVSY
jgi:hypothetical protein